MKSKASIIEMENNKNMLCLFFILDKNYSIKILNNWFFLFTKV